MMELNPAFRVVEKELYVYFKTYYTELTYVILFPFLLVWTMGYGIGDKVDINGIPEKEYQGSFEGVITCPISTREIVFGKILAGTIKSVLNGMIIILILLVVMGYAPPWQIVLSPAILFVTGLFFSAIGIMLGVIIKRGYQLGTIGNLVIFPPTFLGGIFFDLDRFGGGLASVLKLSPVTMMIDGLRKLMVFGDANIALELVVCIITSILLYYMATIVFEKEVII
jgi:ABC-2 type transport system permease protein